MGAFVKHNTWRAVNKFCYVTGLACRNQRSRPNRGFRRTYICKDPVGGGWPSDSAALNLLSIGLKTLTPLLALHMHDLRQNTTAHSPEHSGQAPHIVHVHLFLHALFDE